MSENIVVGIDVSKDKVNVCYLPQDERFEVKAKHYRRLAKQLAVLKPHLVVMEATGGYERPLYSLLADAEIPVAVVNPKKVRDYAKALGMLAKTDDLDAHLIARFALAVDPEPHQYGGSESIELKELIARRRQLVGMRTSEQNRKQQTTSRRVANSIDKTIRTFTKLIAELDEELDRYIKNSPELSEKEEILKSTPGVGDQTARALIIELPELGTLSRGKICALAGVAPMNRDSGKRQGTRYIQGGRSMVRSALYMACITAIRRNPKIHVFYTRLRASGKKAKVAIVACMRKLLIHLNSMLREKQKFNATT